MTQRDLISVVKITIQNRRGWKHEEVRPSSELEAFKLHFAKHNATKRERIISISDPYEIEVQKEVCARAGRRMIT